MKTLRMSLSSLFWMVMIWMFIFGLSSPVHAEQEGNFSYTITNGEAQITGYLGSGNWEGPGSDVTVPSTLGGVQVTSIGDNAFNAVIINERIKSVTLPESIKSVGNAAFYYCNSLISINLPDSVSYIGDYAFMYCNELVNIDLPEGLISIGSGAFGCCDKIENFYISKNVTSIGENAFGNDLSVVGKLISIIVAEENLNYSSTDGVLYNKDKTTLIKCPETKESINISESIKKIDNGAFAGCDNLKNIFLPSGVTNIGDDAFSWCKSLTNININEGVLTIGSGAFNGSGITNIDIPSSVISLGDWAFLSCASLVNINVAGNNPIYASKEGVLYNKELTTLIQCPGGKENVDIADSATSLGHSAFRECLLLSEISLPEGITSIGDFAFCDSPKLNCINIPKGVTDIDYSYFGGCNSLAFITVDSSNPVYSSSGGALYNKEKTCLVFCPGGKSSISLPAEITTIGWRSCFRSNLMSINLPKSVTSIESQAFDESTLKRITINSASTVIADYMKRPDTIPATTTIIGRASSTAEEYKNKYGNPFQLLSNRKAIYVLPGFMGSEIYDTSGLFWLNRNAVIDDANAYITSDASILDRESDGYSYFDLKADIQNDDYGTDDNYKDLVQGLRNNDEISANYDVVFYPYNWLGNLNDEEKALEKHIEENEYQSVTFVTHSTGGLLATAYILNNNNANYVNKAVFIAAPLYGTFDSYRTIETGSHPALNDAVKELLKKYKADCFTGIAAWAACGWVKNTLKNSPTAYQLFPSDEYLKMYPIKIKDNQGKASVTSISQLSSKLKAGGDENINYNLLNGNTWSHQYFRQNTLKGDVVDNLANANVTICLIGSSECEKKPTVRSASYEKNSSGGIQADFHFDILGDGTVPYKSAFGLEDTYYHRLKYADFKNFGQDNNGRPDNSGLDHNELASNPDVINYVIEEISETNNKYGYGIINEGSIKPTKEVNTGMSDYIKYNVETDLPFDVKVTDSSNTVVASVINGVETGFDGGQYIYSVLNAEETRNSAVLYVPNNGVKIAFYTGTEAGVAINFKTDVSTLDVDGNKTATATYAASTTSDAGLILSFDMLSIVDKTTIGNLIPNRTETTVLKPTDWSVPEITKLEISDVKPMELNGTEVEIAKPNLFWETSDASVVEVSEAGILTARSYGVATVTATDGNKVVASQVTVKCLPQAVELSDIELFEGKRKSIIPVFSPEQSTEKDMTYQTDNTDVINIDEYNGITGLAAGTATVTGTTDNGITDTFTVTVKKEKPLLGISLNQETINLAKGNSRQLTVNYDPVDTLDDKTVTWTTSDETIASVDNTGKVTAVGNGEATITATVGSFTASCKVIISETLLGDIDGNGKIQAFDALMALQIATGKKTGTTEEITVADVDKSGNVEAYDALKILQYATGKIPAF